MSFFRAVQSCLAHYASFRGRASRAEYWFFMLFCIILSITANLFGGTHRNVNGTVDSRDIILISFGLALVLPGLAVTIRRLHDLDRSGWSVFVQIIPIVGPIVFLFWMCKPGSSGFNRFGPNPIDVMQPGRVSSA